MPHVPNQEQPQRQTSLVYLCGPIGGRRFSDAAGWRRRAGELLAPEFGVIDPLRDLASVPLESGADFLPRETAQTYTDAEIIERDLRDIRMADLLLRYYDSASEGSPMECAYAKMFGVPVVVCGITDSRNVSPWLRYHSVKILPTLEDATAYIKAYWAPLHR